MHMNGTMLSRNKQHENIILRCFKLMLKEYKAREPFNIYIYNILLWEKYIIDFNHY